MTEKLDMGAAFPSMTLDLCGGGQFAVPGDLSSDYTVVLFYRGQW